MASALQLSVLEHVPKSAVVILNARMRRSVVKMAAVHVSVENQLNTHVVSMARSTKLEVGFRMTLAARAFAKIQIVQDSGSVLPLDVHDSRVLK